MFCSDEGKRCRLYQAAGVSIRHVNLKKMLDSNFHKLQSTNRVTLTKMFTFKKNQRIEREWRIEHLATLLQERRSGLEIFLFFVLCLRDNHEFVSWGNKKIAKPMLAGKRKKKRRRAINKNKDVTFHLCKIIDVTFRYFFPAS